MDFSQEELEVIYFLWTEYVEKINKGVDPFQAKHFGSSIYNDTDLKKSLGYFDVHSMLSNLKKQGLISLFMHESGVLEDDFIVLISRLKEEKLQSKNKKIVEAMAQLIPEININLIKM